MQLRLCYIENNIMYFTSINNSAVPWAYTGEVGGLIWW